MSSSRAERYKFPVSKMSGIVDDHRSKAGVADFAMDVLESLRASVVGCVHAKDDPAKAPGQVMIIVILLVAGSRRLR